MKRIRLAALFVSVSLTASVFAQPPQGGPGRGPGGFGGGGFGGGFRMPNPLLEAMDKDKDGSLSSEEIDNAVVALKTLDKNNDGKLDASEMRPNFQGPGPGGFGGGGQNDAGVNQMVERLIAMDADKDGKLSKEELPERLQSMLTRADKNEDGFLDKTEILASARERSGGAADTGSPGGIGGAEFMAQMMERADADKDGKLTGDEIPPFMRGRLEQLDTNKDGSLDKAELQAGVARMREGRDGEGGRGEKSGGEKSGRQRRPDAEGEDKEAPK